MKVLHLLVPVPKTRAHRVLFDRNLPFRGRREQNKLVYRRRPKHTNRSDVT